MQVMFFWRQYAGNFDWKPWKVFSLGLVFKHGHNFWTRAMQDSLTGNYEKFGYHRNLKHIKSGAKHVSVTLCASFSTFHQPVQMECSNSDFHQPSILCFVLFCQYAKYKIFVFLLGFLNMPSMPDKILSQSYLELELPLEVITCYFREWDDRLAFY